MVRKQIKWVKKRANVTEFEYIWVRCGYLFETWKIYIIDLITSHLVNRNKLTKWGSRWSPLSLSFYIAYRLCRYRHVLPDRIGNYQPNYGLKNTQSTKNQLKTYIARKPINRILLQWQTHEYTPKRNLIIQGRRNRGGRRDVSPPIFETGAFVPPKNYTAKYIYIFFIFYSLLFWKRNTASCHLPHVWQRVGLGAVGSYKDFRLETPSNRCLEE